MSDKAVISRSEAERLLAEDAKLTSLQIEQFLGLRDMISKEAIDEAIKVAKGAGVKPAPLAERGMVNRSVRRRVQPVRAVEGRLTFRRASEAAGQFVEMEVQ